MVHANSIKKEMSSTSNNLPCENNTTSALPTLIVDGMVLPLPLRYLGGDLGLTDTAEPWINFADASGARFLTHSVEWALRHIESFRHGLDQVGLLNDAAMYLGLGAHALLGADMAELGESRNDWRHEGPLVLLNHSLGVTWFTGIAVRSHAGRCGMMLEEVLWRFDQFSAADQAELMAGLAKHFDLGQEETAGAA